MSEKLLTQGGLVIRETPRAHRSYLGYKSRTLKRVLPKVRDAARFIEPFCGGASLSWHIHANGVETVSGDFSHFAYLHAAGSVLADPPEPGWPDLDAEPLDGFASALVRGEGPKQRGKFPLTAKAAAWVDGLTSRGDPRINLALGKVLTTECAPGRWPCWTNRTVRSEFLRGATAKWCAVVAAGIRPGRGTAFNLPAHETVRRADCRGALLYLDPAWPFADGKDASTYYEHPARVGEILAQRQPNPIAFMGTEKHLDYILCIVHDFFSGGGDRALVATQSTNAPPGDEVGERLGREFSLLEATAEDVKGGQHRTGFTEFLFEVRQ